MNVTTITLLFKVIPGYRFRLELVILRPVLTFVLPDTVHTLGFHSVYICRIHPKVCTLSGNTNVNIGLRMTV